MKPKLGRPQVPQNVKQLPASIAFTPEDLAFIDDCAERAGMSRSELVRNLVKAGLQDVRLMKRLGLFDVVGAVRKVWSNRHKQENLPLSR